MKKRFNFVKWICFGIAGFAMLAGCSGKTVSDGGMTEILETEQKKEAEEPETVTEAFVKEAQVNPEIEETDWSEYFDGFYGAAVVYDPSAMQYKIYNRELAETRRSPCSTFKIISSLIALENGIIDPDHSTRRWSGETFWNEEWNRDLDFEEAFRASCVWYFREVADEIGQERMQEELNRLSYGNRDISDWEGRLNTNNDNRALTGFWLESSLAVSPKEQAEVMERIFGEDSAYSEMAKNRLKKAMLVETQNGTESPVYGKTGMGKAQGIVVDAWFTGFAEYEEKEVYFCVYLGQKEDRDVSSAAAREIAVQILSEEPGFKGTVLDENM